MTRRSSLPGQAASVTDVSADAKFRVEDSYLVVLSDQGCTMVEVGVSAVHLAEGELTVVSLESGARVVPDGACHAVCARVPRFVLDPWLADRLTSCGRSIPAETASLAGELLRSLRDEPATIESAEMACILGGFARVVAAALLEDDPVAQFDPDRRLLSEILRHVDFAVQRGRVDPASTARRFGISVRKLHLLFEQEAFTFSQTVMLTRLRWCALVLRTQPGTPLAALAARWGFADSSHLSRNLRRHLASFPVEPGNS